MFENRKRKDDNIRYFEFLVERNIAQGMPISFEAIDAFLTAYGIGEDEVSIAMKRIAASVQASAELEEEYEAEMKRLGETGTIYSLIGGNKKEMGALAVNVWKLRETDFKRYAGRYAKKYGGDSKTFAIGFRGISSWLVSWALIHFNQRIKLIPITEHTRLMEKYYLAINTGERDILAQDLVAKGLLGIQTKEKRYNVTL